MMRVEMSYAFTLALAALESTKVFKLPTAFFRKNGGGIRPAAVAGI